jgi:hypothetical protein
MPPALLLFGLPTWAAVVLIGLVLLVVVFAILKRLFKLALIVGAVAAGVWLGLRLVG